MGSKKCKALHGTDEGFSWIISCATFSIYYSPDVLLHLVCFSSGEVVGGGPTSTGSAPSTAAGPPTPAPWTRSRVASGRAAHCHLSTPLTLSCPGGRGEREWPCPCGSRGPASCADTARCLAGRSCSAALARSGTAPRPRPTRVAPCRCTARPWSTRPPGVWSRWRSHWARLWRTRLRTPLQFWTQQPPKQRRNKRTSFFLAPRPWSPTPTPPRS